MDVFDLYAKLSLDSSDYDRSLQNASNAAEQWKTKMIMAAKAVGSAFSGAVSGISKLVGSSVNAFSSFQQLEGGVETLFGAGGKSFEDWSETFKQSSDSMQDYIDIAQKVRNGDFGVGEKRKDLLAAAGYDPDTVQQMVNNLVNGIDVASNISADAISANMQTAEEKYESLIRAQNNVMENARQAYKTAGLSANEYMNTVTTFTASLIQGLDGDTEKASIYADRALRDMSDNANKMGTDMSLIMNAYQGFSKQNYMMLDNLKLGYGGTKTEMERLIKDAAKLTDVQEDLGITVDANSMSFDNIVNAISVMQKNMGITGTTSKEAATTIEGSTKMMKAAWQNMLTAMVTGGDWFDQSIKDLVESAFTFAHNMIPAIEGAMHGVASLITQLAPLLASELPAFVDDMLPEFINAITAIINGVIDALPSLISAIGNIMPILAENINNLIPSIIDLILEGVPLVIDAGITLLEGLVSGMSDNITTIVPKLTQGIIDMVDHISQIISSDGIGLADAGLALVGNLAFALVQAVPSVLTQITQMVQDLTKSIGDAANGDLASFMTAGTSILTNLVDGLMESIPTLVPQLTEAVAEFITQFASIASSNATDFTNTAIAILSSLITSLGDSGTISKVVTDLTTAVMAIIEAIIDVFLNLDVTTFANACVSIVTQLADGIVSAIGVITAKLPELITKIIEWFTNPDNLLGLGTAALTLFGELVKDVPAILLALTEGLLGIINGIVDFFTNHGEDIKEGFKTGITNAFTNFKNDISAWWAESGKPTFDKIGEKFKEFFLQFEWGETFLNFVNGIKTKLVNLWDNVKDAFTGEEGFFGKIKSWFANLDLLEAANSLVTSLKKGLEGAWEGIKTWFTDKFTHLFDDIDLSKLAFWKKWGKGKDEGGEETEGVDEEGMTIDMPENMMTLDYSNLEPLPEETLASYQTLADAINAINSAISGGGEEGEEGGLNQSLTGLPALFDSVLTSAQSLADFFAGGLSSAIQTLLIHLCSVSEDESGAKKANGGNTLYNALGEVFGLFEDILATSTELAEQWKTEFISASEAMRREAGHATGIIKALGNSADTASEHFAALVQQIYATIDAYLALYAVKGSGGAASGNGNSNVEFKASGGSVQAGRDYIVGEHGPEVFTPSRSGYIVPNEDLMSRRKQDIHVTVNFNGEVIGDEASISSYVNKAAKRAIQEEVNAGA